MILKVNRILFFLLTALYIALSAFKTSAQTKDQITVSITMSDKIEEKGLILYSLNRELKISDFKGPPDRKSPGVAATYSGIKLSISSTTQGSKTDVELVLWCYFDPAKSWMKPEGKNNRILMHEQLHFDITAIQACQFIEEVRHFPFTKNWRKEVGNLYQNHLDNISKMQNLYDKETYHGTIEGAQSQYEVSIKELIEKQACYKM